MRRFGERGFLIWQICLFSVPAVLVLFPRSEGGVKRKWREARKENEEVQLKKWESAVVFPQPIFWHILPPVLVPASKHRDLEARRRKTEADLQENMQCLWHNDFFFHSFYRDVHDFWNVWSADCSLVKLSFPGIVMNNRIFVEKESSCWNPDSL